jgi:hypothetical protein
VIRRHRARRAAAIAGAVLGGVVLLLAGGPPITGRSAAATTPGQAQVTLQGEGSWDPLGEMTTWQNDLYGTSGAISLNYLATGGFSGRQDYLAGDLDYVISGVPFTQAELATLPGGAGDVIDAPVLVSALGVMAARPSISLDHPGFVDLRQVCDPDNPPNPLPPGLSDPDDCANFIPYTGPIRVPADNLAAMLLNYTGGKPLLQNWDNPAVLSAFGVTISDPNDFMGGSEDVWIPQSTGPTVFLRSDPSETNYYVQEYAATAAPTVWAALQTAVRRTFGGITDQLAPGIQVQTRPGVTEQTVVFEQQGASTDNNHGVLAPVPPWALDAEQTDGSHLAAEWVQVQNAAGDWVAPTPASIDAAVNAGGDTPLYALTNNVAGAYPIVYVDHLYAPAHGLSMEKTEALATTIRYLATAGQAATAPVGDGQLSTGLADQALAAANQLVLSNCTGAGETVTTSTGPGPLAPPLKALQGIGPMLHCVAPPAAAVTSATTVTPTSATTAPLSSSGSSGSSGSSAGSGSSGSSAASDSESVDDGTPATTPIAVAPPATVAPGKVAVVSNAVDLAKLPLPAPGSGAGEFDRFTAFIVGAVLLLLVRKPVRSLIRVIQR